jgi:hypothetical protein
MCERDDLQVVSPIPIDEKKGEMLQREAAYATTGTSNNFADRRMVRDQIDDCLYIVPEPIAQTSRF